MILKSNTNPKRDGHKIEIQARQAGKVCRPIYPYGAMNGDVIQVELNPTFPPHNYTGLATNFILSLFAYKRQIVRGRLNPFKKTSRINAFPMHSPSAACLYQAQAATLPLMMPMMLLSGESSITGASYRRVVEL
jgi:hypothetical protein